MQKSGGAVILMNNDKIIYLFGRKDIQVISRIPYEKRCIEFLDSLSKAIRNDVEAKQYPDILTFAFWIRKANILKLSEEYGNRVAKLRYIGKGLVFHIAPSNVPINFAYTLVFGMLAGNGNVVKVSSKKFRQTEIMCRIMNQLMEEEENQWVSSQNAVVMYDRSKEEYTDYFSNICDARVIWGGDDTIEQVRRSPLSPRSTEMTFADRYSFAMMSSQAVVNASEKELKNLAERFYNDTYLMDQNACSSPHLICWMGKKQDFEIASRRFWQEVYHVCTEKYELADVKVSEKYTILCEFADKLEDMEVTRFENALYLVRLKKLPGQITKLRGKFGLFFEYLLENPEELMRRIDKKVQTCAVYGIESTKIADWVLDTHIKGIDRIVPIGKTLDISIIWDGYDVIGELSRCIACV